MTARRAYPRTRPDFVVVVLIGLLLTLGLHSRAAADAPAIPAGDWTLVVNGVEAADVDAGFPLRLHSTDPALDGVTMRITTPAASVADTLSPVGLVFRVDADATVAAAMTGGAVTLTVDYTTTPAAAPRPTPPPTPTTYPATWCR